MPTILQLSETTYINMDQVTVLRCKGDQVQVFFADPTQALALTPAEMAVLVLYLHNHTTRKYYYDVTRP